MPKPIMCSQRHQHLVEELRKVLKGAQAGDRLDSMGAIATQYGVGINTVRMAMMTLQNEGWVRLVHGSGCYVSRPPQVKTGRSIALLSEYNLLLAPVGANFYARLMHELRLVLQAKGISSRLYIGQTIPEGLAPATFTCPDFLEDLELDRLSGVASLATLPMDSWIQAVEKKGLPVVGMGGVNNAFNGAVDPDIVGAIRKAIRQFISNGRSRPAYIGWHRGSFDIFRTALVEVGMTSDPRWFRAGFHPVDPGAGWSDFREIWAGKGAKPDCVIFGDDALFLDALPAIHASGVHVPSELEVVVFSNVGTSLPQPFPYTRLDCDPREFAEAMGTMLLQFIAGEEPASRQIAIPYRGTAQDEVAEEVASPLLQRCSHE